MTEKNVAVFNKIDKGSVCREKARFRHEHLIPAVDIRETEEALVLQADLPGLTREAVEIHVEKGVLTIQGGRAEQEKGEMLLGEFHPGPYFRRFRIPDTVDPGKAAAEFRSGVLTLTLPRVEKAKPRRIEIAAA